MVTNIEITVIGETEQTVIKDLKVTFDIVKTSQSNLNKCNLEVYNLNDDVIAILKKGTNIIIQVAEDDEELKTIFIGNLNKQITSINIPNKITSMVVLDGEKNLNSVIISKAYNEGVSIFNVIKDVANQIGYSVITNIDELDLEDIIFNYGYSVIGPIRSVMDELVSQINATWTIEQEKVKIINPLKPETETIVRLTPETGLLGYPEKTTFKTPSGKEQDGVLAESKLNQIINPGNKVFLKDEKFNSEYKVLKVRHIGDNFGTSLSRLELIL